MKNSVGLVCTFVVNVQNKQGMKQMGSRTIISREASFPLTKSTRRKGNAHMNVYCSIVYIREGTGTYPDTLQQEDKSSLIIINSKNTPNGKKVNEKGNVYNIILPMSV